MSKEIDFSKAPEGATHYREVADYVDWYKKTNSGWQYWRENYNSWYFGAAWFNSALPIPQQWSIYTNDKPLSELSDEQAAALFNAYRNGGEKQSLIGDKWADSSNNLWSDSYIYRIKQKSERELFIEECYKAAGQDPLLTGMGFKDAYGKLFDSGKFKLVEQPK